MKWVSQLGAQRLGSFLQPNLQPPALPEPKKMQDCSSLFCRLLVHFLLFLLWFSCSVVFPFCALPYKTVIPSLGSAGSPQSKNNSDKHLTSLCVKNS